MERDAVGGTKRARHYRKKEAGDLDEAPPSTSDTRTDRRERSRSRSRSTSPPAQPPIGRVLRGSVQSVRDFGVFVRLEGYARDGLLHISQVADERLTADDLRSRFKPGAKVWVKVSSISADGKVGLTARRIDQATGKPVDAPARGNAHAGAPNRAGVPEPIGPPPELFSIHRATVVSSTDFAVFVRLLPSNHDAMVHSTQLEEDRLRAANAKVPADVYANGSNVWVKVSAVDGYSKKAKLQASVKYVDQRDGTDLDPKHQSLLIDLTSRGLPSEMNRRWRNADGPSVSPSPERADGVAEPMPAPGDFIPARTFGGAREGFVFKTGKAGLGYYRDGPGGGGPRGPAGAMVAEAMARLAAEEGERRERKREKKERKRAKKEAKRAKKEKKAKKERRGDEERDRRGSGDRRGRDEGRRRSRSRSRSDSSSSAGSS